MSANSCFIQQHMHCASDTAGTTFNLITMLTEKMERNDMKRKRKEEKSEDCFVSQCVFLMSLYAECTRGFYQLMETNDFVTLHSSFCLLICPDSLLALLIPPFDTFNSSDLILSVCVF